VCVVCVCVCVCVCVEEGWGPSAVNFEALRVWLIQESKQNTPEMHNLLEKVCVCGVCLIVCVGVCVCVCVCVL